MRTPTPHQIPSESTVEQLANHHLLNLISPYGTYFFVPTRREERRLAYDASLQGRKALVIQYKRLHLTWREVPFIKIARRQLSDLVTNFPKGRSPYVFYAFSVVPSYGGLDALFNAGYGRGFGRHVYFVDAHAIPPATTMLLAGPSGMLAGQGVRSAVRAGVVVPSERLLSLADRFLACRVGLHSYELERIGRRTPDTEGGRLPHLNILWASGTTSPA
jgi:hypothetical protein